MHAAARAYVASVAPGPVDTVLEFGSRDINGGIRDLFTARRYVGVDRTFGVGVEVVADAATWTGTGFDVVVCCEVLEHTPDGAAIIAAAHRALNPGGLLIVTCATDPRAPHSAVDGGDIRPDEHYANVPADRLADWLTAAGFASHDMRVNAAAGDLYATATK